MNIVDCFDYPEWAIPTGIDTDRLKTQVDMLLEEYKNVFNNHRQSLYICDNCHDYYFHELWNVVKASIKRQGFPVDIEIMDSISREVRIEIRITWLKRLQNKLNQME